MIGGFNNFNLEKYIKLLPVNLVYAIDDPDEEIRFFNQLVQCIEEHAAIKKLN